MLEDIQNKVCVLQRDKRALAEGCAPLAPNASTSELVSWLSAVLTPNEIQQVDIENANASELLRVDDEKQVVSLLGLTEKAAVKVLAQLNELRDRTAKRVKPEPTCDDDNENVDGFIDRKPDLAQLDAEMSEGDENDNPQAAHTADTEMHNVSQNEQVPHQPQDGEDNEEEKAADGAGEQDEDGDLADQYIKAVEDGGTVPEAAALPWCALVKPDPVVLPDDLSEAKLFAERALLGFVGLMDDLHPACMTDVAKQYGVADSGKSGRKTTKKQRGYTRSKQLCAVWKEVSEGLKHAFDRVSDWKGKAEDKLNKLKGHLHKVLNTANVQNFPSTCRALRRHVPYDQEEVGQEEEDDFDEATKNPKKYRVLLDEQTLERAWALWQATPLIGTIDVPMHARLPQNMNFLTKGSKTASTSRLPQYCWFGKMWDMATNEPNQLRLQAPTTGDKIAEAQALLEIMKKFCKVRYDSDWSQAGILPFVWFERREELDVPGGLRGFNLHCHFFLEGAQATMETSDGMSGFLQFNESSESAQLVDLFRYCNEFQGSDMQGRCNKYSERFVEVAAQVSALGAEKGKTDHDQLVSKAVEGKLFKELLGLVSDTDTTEPEGLKESLKPLLTVEPTRYQLSSVGFVQREEQAEEGLQRHYMWPVTLPHHPDVKAYLIPHCNTLWWASNKELLHPEEHIIGAGVCAMRKPRSIELTGHKSKGGLLGLEMGMGKTLVMIAAHVLEQHKLPEKPEMVTEWTDAELQEFEPVLVGKDAETAKERDMFKGFKQLDDETGTIVPDGSLRFIGLGNLVIVPASIAPQWQQEIQKLCTQEQTVMVLDSLKDRRRFMTSKDGLEELASFDWVVTTPSKAAKDIDLLNAITWRRVIADEAHQIHASTGVVVPENLEPGMTKKNRIEMAFMDMLNRIPATEGHWCLTGTPLKDYRHMASMDRIFRFLNTGVRTQHLHNAGFVNFMMDIAIRFSKKGVVNVVDAEGNMKALRNIELPPVYYETRLVNLNEADEQVLEMAKERLIINSTYSKEAILDKQKLQLEKEKDQNVENAQEEDDDGDEDYEQPLTAEDKRIRAQQRKDARVAKKRKRVMQENDQDAAEKKKKDAMAVKMLSTIVDPLRRILSSAQDMYFDGTVDGPKPLEPSVETLHVGEPEPLMAMKLRKQRGQEPPTAEQYAERRREINERRAREYTEVSITSKVDVLIADVEKIMQEGNDEAGRPPKVIIYSNFQTAFKRIKLFLDTKEIRYASLVDSGMSMKKRAEAMENFKENDEVPVFLLNKSLGATGINLTVANHVLILEPSWNPVFEEQAISRAHRLGQTGPIKVVRYVANDTVDSYLRDLMLQAASEDGNVQEMLMDAVEQKGTFESDDKALNNTIGKIMDLPSLCCLIGDIHVSDDEDDDEEGEEENEEQEE